MTQKIVSNLFGKYFSDYVKTVLVMGGMTNSNYLVETESNKYILKLFGKGTDSFIDRNIEKDNLKIVQQLNLDVPNYVFDIKNGVKINKFIDNAETFDSNLVKSNKKEISEILRNVHTSNKIFSNEFNVFKEIEKYESLLENEVEYMYYNKIREEIFKLQDILEDIGIDLRTCHIDLVPENFIKDKDKIYLIDWEYCAMCDPMWDIAALFLESDFKFSEEGQFLAEYNSEETPVNLRKILIFKILQDFLWSLWAQYKKEQGSDYGDYGNNRYHRALKNLKEFRAKYEK